MENHRPNYVVCLGLYDAWIDCGKDIKEAAKLCEVRQDKIKAAIAWVKAIPITSQNQFDFETGRVTLKNPDHIAEYDRLSLNRGDIVAYNYARAVTLNLGKGASHRPDVKR